MKKTKIGFIGLGIMGTPMAGNLLKGGFELLVYNRTASKAMSLVKAGARLARSPRDLARESEVIILMVTGPEAIEELLSGPEGIFAADLDGKVIINMSTVFPAYSRELDRRIQDHGAIFIDAPVSGSRKPAEEGALIILAGGPEEEIERLQTLFLSLGKKVIYCGPAGQGSAMKMVVNLLLAVMMEGLAEAINLGEACGLKTESILETILSGPLACGLYRLKEEMFKRGFFPAQFPLKHMLKDLRYILKTADEAGAPVPSGHTVFQLYRQAAGRGLAEDDFAAVKVLLGALNDQDRR